MALLSWNERYSVGIREVDEQHKKLIDMINQLHDAMLSGKGREILDKIINSLVDYTKTHFSTEERLMKEYGYPGYLNHKAQHEEFIKKVAEFQRKFENGELTLSMEIMQFLKNWLSEHILGSDKKFGPFLNEKGVA